MQDNADFVEDLYLAIKASDVYMNDPMCSPIGNYFSSLKAHIKQYLALAREEMLNPVLGSNGQPISKMEARMQLLERAAHVSMTKITQRTG
ncbi:Major Facilitator Superfamily (MFS) [Phytophthora cinnamomi]|uniref:Major Facilitator Superfamily (MFS) n=1 Tax=Phytophthora cinnamomi TaxID=4785 RepID=UPI00355A742F|nr:Major Facilitator Superfamily (MFS) [Phytophthora cinnamomi]